MENSSGESNVKGPREKSTEAMAAQIKALQAQLDKATKKKKTAPPALDIESKNGDLPVKAKVESPLGAQAGTGVSSPYGGSTRPTGGEPFVEFHNKVEWAPAYQRNNKANGQKNLRCFPAHCEGLGHQRGFCGRSILVNFYCDPVKVQGPLISFGQFTIADCELGSQAGIAAKGANRDRFNVGDCLPYEHVKSNVRSSEAPLREYVQGLELQDRRMDADGSVRINFEFNRNLKGWHYGFLGSKLTRNLHHIFRVYVLEEVAASASMPRHYRVLSYCTSPDWTLFCRRRNRASIPTAEEIKEQQRKALLEQQVNVAKHQRRQQQQHQQQQHSTNFNILNVNNNNGFAGGVSRALHLPPAGPSAALKCASDTSPMQSPSDAPPGLRKRRDSQPPPTRSSKKRANTGREKGLHARRNTTPPEAGVGAQMRAELGLSGAPGFDSAATGLTSFGSFRGASAPIPMFDPRLNSSYAGAPEPLFRPSLQQQPQQHYMRRQKSSEQFSMGGTKKADEAYYPNDYREGQHASFQVQRQFFDGPAPNSHYSYSGQQHPLSSPTNSASSSPAHGARGQRLDSVGQSVLRALEGLRIPFSDEALASSPLRPLKAGAEGACSSCIVGMIRVVKSTGKTPSAKATSYTRDRVGLTTFLLSRRSFLDAVKKYAAGKSETALDDDMYGNLGFFTALMKKELKAFFRVSKVLASAPHANASAASLSAVLSSAPSFASLGMSLTPSSKGAKSRNSFVLGGGATAGSSSSTGKESAALGLSTKLSNLGLLARRFSAKFSSYDVNVGTDSLSKNNSFFNLNSFRIPSNVNILSFETSTMGGDSGAAEDLESFLAKNSIMVEDES